MDERLQRLAAENEGMRKKLASAKKEQKELQKLLKERESFFNDLPVAVVVMEDERIVEVNPEALDLLGYTRDEAMGRHFIDFVDRDSKEKVIQIHKNVFSGKAALGYCETELVAKDGDGIQVEIRVEKRRHGRRGALVSRLERIEERKKQERKEIESRKAESLMTMAAGVSRSLREALAAISEKLPVLKERGDSGSGATTKSFQSIQDAVSRMMRLNQALERFCEGTPDKSEMSSCDLRKIVSDVIAVTQTNLKENEKGDSKVHLKAYLRSVSLVKANPSEMHEMIFHVMNNAVDAMPHGGDLYVSTEETAGYAYVFIQDSGVGIPEHLLTRVFDPFFTTKGHGKIGLGLSLAQGIARKHQGSLEIASRKDQGTIVSIRIPLAGHGEKARKGAARGKIKGAHILIIEDDHMIRELLSQLLKSKGYKVTPATNGAEALHHLRKKRVDMAVIGAHTPDMESHALAREIKRGNDKIPVALIAGHEETGQGEGSSADLIIAIPLDMKRVLNQIASLLTSKARAG
jgi:PAS domain S-box-containing protein